MSLLYSSPKCIQFTKATYFWNSGYIPNARGTFLFVSTQNIIDLVWCRHWNMFNVGKNIVFIFLSKNNEVSIWLITNDLTQFYWGQTICLHMVTQETENLWTAFSWLSNSVFMTFKQRFHDFVFLYYRKRTTIFHMTWIRCDIYHINCVMQFNVSILYSTS